MSLQTTLTLLRAAADGSRLRLLAALAHGEATVAELMQVLEQSQPRVSRHLRLLAEAGLVERVPEGRYVYYRLGESALLPALLAALDSEADTQIEADAHRLDALRVLREREALRGRPRTTGRPDERALVAVLDEFLGRRPLGTVLEIGSGTALRLLGPRIRQGFCVEPDRALRLLARARLHAAGLAHCSLRDADPLHLPFADGAFNLVILDGVLARVPDPAAAVAEARRVLDEQGELLVIDRVLPGVTSAEMTSAERLNFWLTDCGLHPACHHWLPGRSPDQAVIRAVPGRFPKRTGTDG
ncbi:MAG: metalloregulator ArsR/SmtB family transcription factor [Chromatiales bacterium]|nr:metalloregulator ArsR/SmtB family transcription factor [Chromatiales bacterium]